MQSLVFELGIMTPLKWLAREVQVHGIGTFLLIHVPFIETFLGRDGIMVAHDQIFSS